MKDRLPNKRAHLALAVITSLSLSASTVAAFEPSAYLCRPDSSVGFRYNDQDGKWHPTIFSTPEKYVLRQFDLDNQDREIKTTVVTERSSPTWGFFSYKVSPSERSQVASLQALCRVDNSPYHFAQFICNPFIMDVRFNENTSKFMAYFAGGYLFNPDVQNSPDTPLTVIGHCEPYISYSGQSARP